MTKKHRKTAFSNRQVVTPHSDSSSRQPRLCDDALSHLASIASQVATQKVKKITPSSSNTATTSPRRILRSADSSPASQKPASKAATQKATPSSSNTATRSPRRILRSADSSPASQKPASKAATQKATPSSRNTATTSPRRILRSANSSPASTASQKSTVSTPTLFRRLGVAFVESPRTAAKRRAPPTPEATVNIEFCWDKKSAQIKKKDPELLNLRKEHVLRLIKTMKAYDFGAVVIEEDPKATPPPGSENKKCYIITSLLGIPYRQDIFTADHLRKIVTRLGVVPRGLLKSGMELAIIEGNNGEASHDKARNTELQESEGIAGVPKLRKGSSCAFRLINVLLCDTFRESFANIYASQNRDLLESGQPLKNDEYFWSMIQEAFVDREHEFNASVFSKLHSDRLELTLDPPINPGEIIQHDWVGLRKIFNNLKSSYSGPFARYKMSGNHQPDFWKYCDGDREVLYMHEQITKKDCPDIHSMCASCLPDGVAIESSTGQASTPNPATTTKGSKKYPLKGAKGRNQASGGHDLMAAAQLLADKPSSVAKRDAYFESMDGVNRFNLKSHHRREIEAAKEKLQECELELLRLRKNYSIDPDVKELRLSFLLRRRKAQMDTISDSEAQLGIIMGTHHVVDNQQQRAAKKPKTAGSTTISSRAEARPKVLAGGSGNEEKDEADGVDKGLYGNGDDGGGKASSGSNRDNGHVASTSSVRGLTQTTAQSVSSHEPSGSDTE